MRWAPAVAVGIALIAGALGHGLRDSRPGWVRAELSLLDAAFRARGPQPTTGQVVLIEVDDRTIDERPELLERRAENARLVRALHQAGAAVVALDLFFAEPERLLPDPLQRDLDRWVSAPEPGTPPEAGELLARVHAETLGDQALADALAEAGALLAVHVGQRGGQALGSRDVTRGTYGQVVGGDLLPPADPTLLASDERFTAAAARQGAITVHVDASGAVRQIPLALRLGQRLLVPFGLQAVAAADQTPRGRLAYLGSDGTARLGDRVVRGEAHRVWLNWRGQDAFPRVSAVELLDPEFDAERVRGRIAMVGYTHLASDAVRGPFGSHAGVEVHATAADNLLADDFLRRAPAWADALLALACGGVLAAGFALPGGVLTRVAGGLGAAALAGGLPMLTLSRADLWVGSLSAWVAVAGGALGAVAAAWMQEGRQARALRRTFAHYLSDELIEVMVADPGLVQLRGQRRTLSVLFSDVRDFTSFAERIPPLELAGFLRAYLTPMTRAVFDHRGYVDKFIGDAVMALFGAPVPDSAHALHACRAALAMWEALAEVRPAAEALGIELAIGVGVNTGEVAVGNLGSAERFEYTVLGDAVNLASRLEGLTKTYGVFCLIGPATASALPAEFALRRVDLVRVKGKAEPVEVFELCGDGRVRVASYAEPERWEAAIEAWRRGELGAARSAFLAFQRANPADPVAALYLDRLDALGEAPPAGWDGVFTHTRK